MTDNKNGVKRGAERELRTVLSGGGRQPTEQSACADVDPQRRAAAAENYFRSGLNCCQSVLMAFKDAAGLSEQTLMKLGAPMGAGMGRLRQTCGAVTAAFMLSGLLLSDGDKARDYARVQQLAGAFSEKNGSYICAELLDPAAAADKSSVPSPRTSDYYKKRPCALLCADAARLLAAAYLAEREQGEDKG